MAFNVGTTTTNNHFVVREEGMGWEDADGSVSNG